MNLQVADLRFSYRGRPVLEQVSLEVPSGSFCTLLGANGAGKTTLLKCMAGLLHPQGGRVQGDGEDLLALSTRQRAQRLGYVPQNVQASHSALTVWETVLSGRVPYRRGRLSREDRQAALEVVEQLHLEELALRPLDQLSGGERQRVFIARALAQHPQALLLDEPTSNLDLRFQQETLELLDRLRREWGLTLLAVLHDPNAAIAYASQAAVLVEGRVWREGPPAQVLDGQALWEAFGYRASFAWREGVGYVVPARPKDSL